MPGGVRTEIHLGGQDTGGAFCLLVDEPPVGWALPAHRHRGVAETIHVLAGDFDMAIDGRQTRLTAGQTVHVPGDVAHAGANIGSVTGRRMVIFSPAGMEKFFLELGTASADEVIEPTAALACATRYGWEFVGR